MPAIASAPAMAEAAARCAGATAPGDKARRRKARARHVGPAALLALLAPLLLRPAAALHLSLPNGIAATRFVGNVSAGTWSYEIARARHDAEIAGLGPRTYLHWNVHTSSHHTRNTGYMLFRQNYDVASMPQHLCGVNTQDGAAVCSEALADREIDALVRLQGNGSVPDRFAAIERPLPIVGGGTVRGTQFTPPISSNGALGDTSSWFGDYYATMACGTRAANKLQLGVRAPDTLLNRVYFTCVDEVGLLVKVVALAANNPQVKLLEFPTPGAGNVFLDADGLDVGELSVVSLHVSDMDRSLYGVFVRTPAAHASNRTTRSEFGRIETCVRGRVYCPRSPEGTYTPLEGLPSSYLHSSTTVFTPGSTSGYIHGVFSADLSLGATTHIVTTDLSVSDTYLNGTRGDGAVTNSPSNSLTSWHYDTLNMMNFENDLEPPKFLLGTPLPSHDPNNDTARTTIRMNEPGSVAFLVVIDTNDPEVAEPVSRDVVLGVDSYATVPDFNTSLVVCHKTEATGGTIDIDFANRDVEFYMSPTPCPMYRKEAYRLYFVGFDDETPPNYMPLVETRFLFVAGMNATESNITVVEGKEPNEPGGEATYGIRLTGRPKFPVTVRVSIERDGLPFAVVKNAGSTSTDFASYAEFTFTRDDWKTYQYVAVRPTENDLFSWRLYRMSHVFSSLDPLWDGVHNNTRNMDEVDLRILDDDVPTVVMRGNGVAGTGNLTAAEGNHTAFVMVSLSQAPEVPVTIRFKSDVPSVIGVGQVEGFDTFAVFNYTNFDIEQKISLFPMHNDVKHNPARNVTIDVSMTTASIVYTTYDASQPPDVIVTLLDSNDAGVEILNGTGFSNLTAPVPRLLTEEGIPVSAAAELVIRLKSQPRLPVTVTFMESGASTAALDPIYYQRQQLIFDPPAPIFSPSATAQDGWSRPKTIRIYGISDKLAEGQMLLDVSFVCKSEDANYNDTWTGASVTMVIPPLLSNTDGQAWNPYRYEPYQNSTQPMNVTDADVAGVNVLSDRNVIIEERYGTNVTVQLLTTPFRDVTLTVRANCTSAKICHKLVFEPETLTFPAGANPIQAFEIMSLEDIIVTADSIFTIYFDSVSVDQMYNSTWNAEFVRGEMELIVLEDDVLGVLFDPDRLGLEEGAEGAVNTFSVNLATQPQFPVEVSVYSPFEDDGLQIEVIPGPSLFTITPDSWDVLGAHKVKVRALDDRKVESTSAANVCLSFVSQDPFYNDYKLPNSGNPACIIAVIQDNDVSNATEAIVTYILADADGNVAGNAPQDIETITGAGVSVPAGAVQYLPGGVEALPFPTGSVADQPIPGLGATAASFPIPGVGGSTSGISNGKSPAEPTSLGPGMTFTAPPGVPLTVELPAGTRIVPPPGTPGNPSATTLGRGGLARVEPGWTVVLPADAGATVDLPSPTTVGIDGPDSASPDLFLNTLSGPMRIDFTTASEIVIFMDPLEGITLVDAFGNVVPLDPASGGRISASAVAGGSIFLAAGVKDVGVLLPYDAVVGAQYAPTTVSADDVIRLPDDAPPTPINGLPVGTVIRAPDGTTQTVTDPKQSVVAVGGSTIVPPESAVNVEMVLPYGVTVGGTTLAAFPGGSTLSYPNGYDGNVPPGSTVLDAQGTPLRPAADGSFSIPPGGSVIFPMEPDPASATVPEDATVAARAGAVVIPPDLTTIKVPGGTEVSYIALPPGSVIIAADGTVTPAAASGSTKVPPGATIRLPDGTSPRSLTLPLGSTFSTGSDDPEDAQYLVPLAPGDSIRVTEPTTLYVPAGTVLRQRDGTIITTPSGGGVVDLPAGASVTAPLNEGISLALPATANVAGTTSMQTLDAGSSFTTPPGGVTTTITLPPGTTAVDQYGQPLSIPLAGGPVAIPPGSTVTLPDTVAGTAPIRIPAGSEITSPGGVAMTLATIQGGTTIRADEPFTASPGSLPPGTVVTVNGTVVEPNEDGSYTIPEGALVTVPADGPPATIQIPSGSDITGKVVKSEFPEGTSIRLPIVAGNFTVFVPPGTRVYDKAGKVVTIPPEGGWLELTGGSIIELPTPCPSPCEAVVPAAAEIGDTSVAIVPGGATVTIPDDGSGDPVEVKLPPGTVVRDENGNVVNPSTPGGPVTLQPGWTFTTPRGKPSTIVLPTQGTNIESPSGKNSGADGSSKNAIEIVVQEVSLQSIPSPPPPDQFELTSGVVNYSPSPTTFAKPVEIRIKVPSAYLLTIDKAPEEILKELYFIYAATLELGEGTIKNPATNSQWSIVPGGVFSFREDGSIDARLLTTHFSNYAVTRIKPLLQLVPYSYRTGYITHVEGEEPTVFEPLLLIDVIATREIILVKGAIVSVRSRSSARFQSYNISNPTDRLVPEFDESVYVAVSCDKFELAIASSDGSDSGECIEWTLITKGGTVFAARWDGRNSDLYIEPIGGVSGMEGVCAKEQLETVLRTIAYKTVDKNPDSNNLFRKIDYNLLEVYVNSTIKMAERPTLIINPVDSAPDVLVARSAASYFEGQGSLVVDPGITAIDYDSPCLIGAAVAIIRLNVTYLGKDTMLSNPFNAKYERLTYDPQPVKRFLQGALADPVCGGNLTSYVDNSSPSQLVFTGRFSSDVYSVILRSVSYTNSRFVFPPPSTTFVQYTSASLNVTNSVLLSSPAYVRVNLVNRNNRPQVDRTLENTAKIFDVCKSSSGRDECIPNPPNGPCGTGGSGCGELVVTEDGVYRGMLRFVDYDEVAPSGEFVCAGSIGEADFVPNTTEVYPLVPTLFTETFEYRPLPNKWGNDVLLVAANDVEAGAPSSAPTAVRVKVLPVNDPPIAVDVQLTGDFAVYCHRVEGWCQTVHFEADGRSDCLYLDVSSSGGDGIANEAEGEAEARPRAICLTRDVLWKDPDGSYDDVFDYTLVSEPSPYPDNPPMGSRVSMLCTDGVSTCDLFHDESCDDSCYEAGRQTRKGKTLFSYTPGPRFLEMKDVEVAYDFFTFSVRDRPKCMGIDVADVLVLDAENQACPVSYQYVPPATSNVGLVNIEIRFYDNLHNKPPYGLTDITVRTDEGQSIEAEFPPAEDEHPQDVVYAIITPPSLGAVEFAAPALDAAGSPRLYGQDGVQYSSTLDPRGFRYTPLPFLTTDAVGYDSFTYAAIDSQGEGLMSDEVKTVYIAIEPFDDVPHLPCSPIPEGTVPSLNATVALLVEDACQLLRHRYATGSTEKPPAIYRRDLLDLADRYDREPLAMFTFSSQYAAIAPFDADLRARALEKIEDAARRLMSSTRAVAAMMPATTRQVDEQAVHISLLVEASVRMRNVPTVTPFNVSNTGQGEQGKRPYASALASYGNPDAPRLFTKWNALVVPIAIDVDSPSARYRVELPTPADESLVYDGGAYQRNVSTASSLALVQIVPNPGNASVAPTTIHNGTRDEGYDLYDRHFIPILASWKFNASSQTVGFEFSDAAALFAVAYHPRPGARIVQGAQGELGFNWRALSSNASTPGAEANFTVTSPCQPGFVAEDGESSECEVCAPGTFLPDDTSLDQLREFGFGCRACPVGLFSRDFARTISCESCELGFFADREGLPACSACPEGMTTALRASHRRSLCRCETGTLEIALKPDSAEVDSEKYPLPITEACYEAFETREAYERLFGQNDNDNATRLITPCDAVRAVKEGNRRCEVVSNSLLRLEKPGLYYPLTFRGVYVDPSAPTSYAECQPINSCLQHNTQFGVSQGKCGPGENGTERYNSTGMLGCRTCVDGSFRVGDYCSPCPGTPLVRAVLGASIVFALLFLLRKASMLENGFGAISIFVAYLQIQSELRQLDLPFDSRLRDSWKISSILNLNPDLLAYECHGASQADAYRYKLYTMLALPVAMLVLTLARIFLGLWKSHLSVKYSLVLQHRYPNFFEEPDWSYKYNPVGKFFTKLRYGLSLAVLSSMSELESRTYVRTCTASLLLFLHMLYFSLCTELFNFFRCFEDERGDLRLYASPDVLCYRGVHNGALPLAVIGLSFYTVGIALASYVILLARQRVIVHREANQAVVQRALYLVSRESYGFLFEMYEPRWFTFETVNLLRKVAIAGVIHLLENPVERGCSTVAVMLLYMYVVVQLRPHITTRLSMFEFFLGVVNVLVVLLGLVRHSSSFLGEDSGSVDAAVLILVWTTGCIGIVYCMLEMHPVLLKAIADLVEMRQKQGMEARMARMAKQMQRRMMNRSVLQRTANAVEPLLQKARAVFDRATLARITDYMAKASKPELANVKRIVNKLYAVCDTSLNMSFGRRGVRRKPMGLSQEFEPLTSGIVPSHMAEKLYAWMALHATSEEKDQMWQILERLAEMANPEAHSRDADVEEGEDDADAGEDDEKPSDLRYDFRMRTWVANADGDPLSGMRRGETDGGASAAATESQPTEAQEGVDYAGLAAEHEKYWTERAKAAAQEAAKMGKEWGKRSRPRRLKKRKPGAAAEGGLLPPSKEEFEQAARETTRQRHRKKSGDGDTSATDEAETDATTSGDEAGPSGKQKQSRVVSLRTMTDATLKRLASANGVDASLPREEIERQLEAVDLAEESEDEEDEIEGVPAAAAAESTPAAGAAGAASRAPGDPQAPQG